MARCLFLSQDRADMTFAVKELCQKMSDPSQHSTANLKRLVRYLKGERDSGSQFSSSDLPPWNGSSHMRPCNFSHAHCKCTRPHRTLNQPWYANRQAVFLTQHHLARKRTFARYLRHRVQSPARTWLCPCRLSATACRRDR